MGILDSIFGGGQQGGGEQAQPQGPPPDSWHNRFQAEYAPGAYGAHQDAARQRAVYDAAMQTPGMAPQIAQALAMSPQYFGAQQGSFLPQPSQIQTVNNSDGGQTLLETRNPGGGAGHGHSLSGLPIVPPGTTANPTAAAGGASGTTPKEQTGNAPATVSGPQDDALTPAPVPGSTNTLNGMPGSNAAILAQIKANKAAGKDPTLGIPEGYKDMAHAVLDGRETLKTITSQRGAQTRNAINEIALSMDPNFDENMNEARNTFRKQYASGHVNDIGGQVKSINKLAGHANAMADAATDVDNIGLGGSGLAHPINALGNYIHSTPVAGLRSAADKYVAEKNTYLAGKAGGTDKGEREARRSEYSGSATPQEMGTSLLSDIDFIEKQMEGNNQHRDAVFSNPKMREQFALASPEALKNLNEAKIKAHKLIGDYDEWSKNQGTTGNPGTGWSNFRVGK